jgi:uncharacterized membrane protein YecN with MAPEG domain
MSIILESSVAAFGFYAALNALIVITLSMLVVRARARTQTLIGDGGNPEVMGAIRAHANNAEYVPIAFVLMWTLTSPLSHSIWMIHAVGAPLTIGRILHGYGLSHSVGTSMPRSAGMILTYLAYVIGIVAVLWVVFLPQMAVS